MSVEQMNILINKACFPEFKHVSKTYLRGCCLNVAYGKKVFQFNMEHDFHYALMKLEELRK